jgi:ATP-dependent helicase/nuclease subunit A
MRVLYVAMTRAKEKLILLAATPVNRSAAKWASRTASAIPDYTLATVHSYLDWLMLPLIRHPAADPVTRDIPLRFSPDFDAPKSIHFRVLRAMTEEAAAPSAEVDTAQVPDTAAPSLPAVEPALIYSASFLQDLPAKVTATGRKRGFQAEEAAENAGKDSAAPSEESSELPQKEMEDALPENVGEMRRSMRRPNFETQTTGLTPAEQGTAHHLFLQFARYDGLEREEAVQNELDRLREARILTPEQAAAVHPDRIAAFFRGPISRLMQQNKVRREFKFSVLAPAALFEPQAARTPEETVLLQGVIDCLIETPEGFLILDFKTDRVSKTRAASRAAAYQGQLEAYRYAVREIFGKPVQRCILYFLHCGTIVEL